MSKEQIDYPQDDLVDPILNEAIKLRASDIHFDPERDRVDIRYRIDGVLRKARSVPPGAYDQIMARLKVLSRIDTTVHRLPQDGHFEFVSKGDIYNFRISTVPTTYEQATVLRILDREDFLVGIENLGFDDVQKKTIFEILRQPFGVVLTTGPGGSGKTTLLYSFLGYLNSSENNIITIEDPVELEMEGLRQIQTNENMGLTFASALRSVLRQSPDIIMVGEIRDSETAQLAMQAALTGHLVFSTFHTLDIPALVIRMIEMGVPRSVVAHTITGVISARLVRKVCADCAEPVDIDSIPAKLRETLQTGNIIKGKGCNKCDGTGYKGREGVFEIAPFDSEIKTVILENGSAADVNALMSKKKVESMEEAAFRKVYEGITTIEEAVRITGFLLD